MATLTITRGLPASGKSTWAETQRQADPEYTRVVTMDDIRTAIGARFEAGDEYIVQSIRDFTIRNYLVKGYHVISADTNLPEKTVRKLQGIVDRLNVEGNVDTVPWITVEFKDFRDVPLATCLHRNTLRHTFGDFKVPHEAIESMHERFIKNS